MPGGAARPHKDQRHQYELEPLHVSNGAASQIADGNFPKRLKVFGWGANPSLKGEFAVTDRTAKELPERQAAAGFDRICLDFEHNTLPGHPTYEESKEPRPIAAHGVPLVVPGEGLFIDELMWTPEGMRNALNYPDLSPCPTRDKDTGEVLFLHSVALCRQGAARGVTFLNVSPPQAAPAGGGTDQQQGAKENTPMDKWKELLLAILGLSEDASDEQITEAAKAFGEAAKKQGGEVVAMSARQKDMAGQIVALSARLEAKERDDIARDARMEGKVIPLSAEDVAKTPVETLRAMVKGLPVTVPLSSRLPEGGAAMGGSGGGTPALSGEQREVNRMLGITDELFKKFNAVIVAGLIGLGAMLCGASAKAAAATEAVNTPERAGAVVQLGVATNKTIYAGTIVAANSSGFAQPASDATGEVVVGRAEETVANTGTNGAVNVDIKRGVFKWSNSATDAVDGNDVGKFCYVADDQTVNEVGGSNTNRAGIVVAVDSDGVWVDTTRVTHPTTSVGNDAVGNANIADGAVSLEHLDSGIAPARVPTLWTNVTITGATMTNAVTITGTATTSSILATFQDNPQQVLRLIEAKPTLNTVTIITDIAPTNAVIGIGVFKPAS